MHGNSAFLTWRNHSLPCQEAFQALGLMGRMLFITERTGFLPRTTRMQGAGAWACKYLLMRSRSLRLTSRRWPFPGLYNLSLVIQTTQDITSVLMGIMNAFPAERNEEGPTTRADPKSCSSPSESGGKRTTCISHWVLRRESWLVPTLLLRDRWTWCVRVLKDESVLRGKAAARVRAPSRRTLLIVHHQQILKFPYVAGFQGLC